MRFHLSILVVLSAVVHIGVIANSSLTARDSLGFARQAVNLAHPERCDWGTRAGVLRNTQQPPGYPLAILAVDGVVAQVWNATRAEQMLLATQVASGLAGVLIVLPLYGLARTLMTSRMAFAAVGVYTLLPAVARYTSDGLSESCFLLAILSAIFFASGGHVTKKGWLWLLAGMATGCAYLVRPEGLAVGVAAAIGSCFYLPLGRPSSEVRQTGRGALAILMFGIGFAVLAVPYIATIGGITNKPAARELLEASASAPTMTRTILAEFRPTDSAKDAVSQVAWCLRATGMEFLRATHFTVGILAFLAVVSMGRALFRQEYAWRVLLVFAGLHVAFVLWLAYRHGYVSDRHILPIVPIAALLAFRLLDEVARCGWIVAIVIAATCLPGLTKSLHENRVGHKHAGRYLAGVLGERDELYDPFAWEGFYAGRTVEAEAKPIPNPTAIYAVLDDARGEGAHPRLRQMPEALQVSRDPRSELVYKWPVGVSEADAKVRVYRMKLTQP